MPPKDDEDPKSTKDVVTKKQKQLLNREELDLSLIAEAFGGVIVEAEIVQPSFKGTGRRSIIKKEVPTTEDPKEKLERLLSARRKDKYQTNKPVSGKQAQQFDIDIAGKAAEEKSGAGGKPGAGQTKSLKGQTITKGPYKEATPISKREASLLRKYARSPGVGQNPLRAEPGSGAELTAGRKRSLKASARRAVEKQAQARRSAVGKQIKKAGSELLSQIQQQSKKAKDVERRMGRGITRMGKEVLKQVQQSAPQQTPKGQLSLPGLGKSFGRGAGRRAQAAQDAAIDIAKQERKDAGMKDLLKAVKGTRPVSGAAADPWKQFPKKPQKQQGLPKPKPEPTPSTKALPPAKGSTNKTMTPKQVRQLLIPGYGSGSTGSSNLNKSLKTISSFPFVGSRVKAGVELATTAIDLAKTYRKIRDKKVESQKQDLELSLGLRQGRQPSETPTIKPFKPKKPFQLPSFPVTKPKDKPKPELEPEKSKDKKGTKVIAPPKSGSVIAPGTPKSPGKTPSSLQSPDRLKVPVPPAVKGGLKRPPLRPDKKKDRKLRFGFPDQPGGVVGRRQNPQ